MTSRRQFLKRSSTALAFGALASRFPQAQAEPLGLPLGLQLYSIREQLAADFEGTLAKVAAAGYREVETAGFFNHSAAESKAAFAKAGLRCVSSHIRFAELQTSLDETIAFHKTIGAEAIICPSAGTKVPGQKGMTIDDWRWSAEQFNSFGTKINAAGLRFGYHNHTPEFAPIDGVVPYDELLRLTDPSKVTFELDCGWAVVAGVHPVDLFKKYPNRISMLHVKDFRLPEDGKPSREDSKVTELGMGDIHYRPIFEQAAKSEKVRHIFVEQEAFDMPWTESLQTDADYMRKIRA